MLRDAGQAGTLDRSRGDDAGGLRFETRDDALHYASELVEAGRRRLATENFHITDLYRQGRCDAVVVVAAGADSGQFYLVARAVPFASKFDGANDVEVSPAKHEAVVVDADGEHPLVLVRTRHLPQSPEFIVPSKVWAEGADECDKIRLGTPKLAGDFSLQIIDGSAHWEVDVPNVVQAQALGGVAGGLIEGVPKLVDNSVGGQPDSAGNAALKARANDLLAGLTIHASDNGVSWSLDKARAGRFEICDAFFRALED